ncbi:hypothetical protein KAFR_0C01940 [Kazachstania africana CBS 2517]|uniref:U3 small nucleolar RNA-associated protein 8 n=1 Tax=Kazachstania africana (strain ATCC 22294 / BCRC 22015 / CBS 2517 / CECT 1963 / NBRC 1671 / NRRL Y-8276) TaxID=1071382 RepID=H2AS37_KAZAF|nr:hypothetical protein KAFR_0C01940 [Kazachstania africana CBS 2517]CCF57187.1 hypothetical protein KAFR_0C01940 [Kazachstania africana CBS 2517]
MPSISQPFAITTVPKQSSTSPIIVSSHSLTANSNSLDVAISKYAVSKFVINPTPKLINSIPIPSNEVVTAFHDTVFATATVNQKYTLHLNGKKVPIQSKIMKLFSDESQTITILENGTIEKYDSNLIKSTYKTPHKDLVNVEFIESKYALLISQNSISLYDINTMIELRNVANVQDIVDSDFKSLDGKLYQFNQKLSKFDIWEISSMTIVNIITIPFINDVEKDVVSFTVVDDNCVVMAVNSTIYALNLHLSSVISMSELLNLKWFKLIDNLSNQFVLGLSFNNENYKFELINLDLNSNFGLKDSLGKGFRNFLVDKQSEKETLVLKSLFSADEADEDLHNDSDSDVEHTFNYDKIIVDLNKAVKNPSKFDKIFFEKFNIKKEHYTEADRFLVNQDFLAKVIELILQNYKFDTDGNNYPKTLTYLLTHPLFPVSLTKNLLPKFRESPRLYKQAIVTCPNLPLGELLADLFTIENNELSLDISLRVLQDYTKDSIKEQIKLLPKVDIRNFIEFVTQDEDQQVSSQLFQLLSLIIDSIGLFALDMDILGRISNFINEKTLVAKQNSELLHLLDYNPSKQSSARQSSKLINNNNKSLHRKTLPTYTVEHLDL